MPKTIFRGAMAFVLLFLLASPRALLAWGNVGHEAVAYVAWQQMTPEAKARVMVLLAKVPTLHEESGDIPGYSEWVADLPAGLSQDKRNQYLFMRAATWADSIKHHGLSDSDTPPAGVTTDVNIGFGDDRSHGYWHFIDTAFASDGGVVPPTPVPNVVTQIAAMRDFIASDEGDVLKAYDLLWLEHLVGDVHQPLHGTVRYNGGSGDAGGNLVKIKLAPGLAAKFKCPPSTTVPRELHAFWDDLPGSCPANTGVTAAANFAKSLPLLLTGTQLPGADRVAVADPVTWAGDSLTLAEANAYVLPIGPGTHPETGTAFLVDATYYDQALAVAKAQIALAGARLAKMLNENLK